MAALPTVITPVNNPHLALAVLLSVARLAPYLRATGGDDRRALKLYWWNVQMSSAVYECLHLLEVVLRNAIDAQLRIWNATQLNAQTGQPHGSDWLLDPSRLLRRLMGDDIDKAKRHAKRAAAQASSGARQVTHDDVLAQLTMGTWRFLLPSSDPGRQRLWTDAVSGAFPCLTRAVPDLVDDIGALHKLRNRVAHLEPLLETGSVLAAFTGLRRVMRDIEPSAERWMLSHQRVTSVAAKKV